MKINKVAIVTEPQSLIQTEQRKRKQLNKVIYTVHINLITFRFSCRGQQSHLVYIILIQ